MSPSFFSLFSMVLPASFLFGHLPASRKHLSSTGPDDKDHLSKKSQPGDMVLDIDPSPPTEGELHFLSLLYPYLPCLLPQCSIHLCLRHLIFPRLQKVGHMLTRALPFRTFSKIVSQSIFFFVCATQARLPSCACFSKIYHNYHDF
jgi:hypothetical protein